MAWEMVGSGEGAEIVSYETQHVNFEDVKATFPTDDA